MQKTFLRWGQGVTATVISLFVAIVMLSPPSTALAAVSDCVSTAADGTRKCTQPIVQPDIEKVYGTCIANNLSTTEASSNFCSTQLGITSLDEGSIKALIDCVGARLYEPDPPKMGAFNWQLDGASDSSAAWLCGTATALYKYGVEMRSFDSQSLYYKVISTRSRKAKCPDGYAAVGANTDLPDYCIKPAAQTCPSVGNPIVLGSGEKRQQETDISSTGTSALSLTRFYSSSGLYVPVSQAAKPGKEAKQLWRHSYMRQVVSDGAVVTALRPDGSERHFRGSGQLDALHQGTGRDTLSSIATGYVYRGDEELEQYDLFGRLVRVVTASGASVYMVYSDSNTPIADAPAPGYLISVLDDFGRSVKLKYDWDGQWVASVDADGNQYSYSYGGKGLIVRVDNPDATFRTYTYGESTGPYALTGIIDEAGVRYATYRYDANGFAVSTEHAGSVEKYVRTTTGSTINVVDPVGTTRSYQFQELNGISRLISQSQPAGSGCNASSSALAYDAVGNISSEDDFNGNRTCYVQDARNNETTRIEGVPSTTVCSSVTPVNVSIPTGARRISTQWHSVWHFATRIAEPKKLTTFVYNGQPDPLNGNVVATCAPASALLPTGDPIAVLCKKVEQATTDSDGHLGFASALQSGVANRQWTWTYNGYGQVLTAKGSRTDVNETTTFAYYGMTTADYTKGDLATATNPLNQVTQYLKYNKQGQALKVVAANGVITDNVFDIRQRPVSSSAAGLQTIYEYWPHGAVKKLTQPGGTVTNFIYDDAHRLIGVVDSAGNSVKYTLDGLGNRTSEEIKDSAGTIIRTISRTFDALGRVQSVTGASR